MKRGLCANACLSLIGLLFACLFCQAYPAMAETHHSGSSEPGCAFASLAEAVPTSTGYLLGGASQHDDQGHNLVVTSLALLAVVAEGDRRAVLRQTSPLFPGSVKRYQLHRVYRL